MITATSQVPALDEQPFDAPRFIDAFLWESEPTFGELFASVTRTITELYQGALTGLPDDSAAEAVDYLAHHLVSIVEEATQDIEPGATPKPTVDRGAVRLALAAVAMVIK